MAGNPLDLAWPDGVAVPKAGLKTTFKSRMIQSADNADEIRSMDADGQVFFYLKDVSIVYELIPGDTTSADSGGTTPAILVSNDNYRYQRLGQLITFSAEWTAVSVSGGQATIDLDVSDKFLLTVDADCELQLPDNPQPGRTFVIRVVYSGTGHAFTHASGWQGDTPVPLDTDGDETWLAGMVGDISPSTTAIINVAKQIPA